MDDLSIFLLSSSYEMYGSDGHCVWYDKCGKDPTYPASGSTISNEKKTKQNETKYKKHNTKHYKRHIAIEQNATQNSIKQNGTKTKINTTEHNT